MNEALGKLTMTARLGGLVVLLLAGAWWVSVNPSVLPQDALGVIHLSPVILMAFAAFLCWRFKRSRCVFGILAVGMVYALTLSRFPREMTLTNAPFLFTMACILLPLNLAALPLFKDRGILTPRGLLHAACMAAQVAMVAALATGPGDWSVLAKAQAWLVLTLSTPLLPPALLQWTAVPSLGVIAMAICLVTLIGQVLVVKAPSAGGMLAMAIASFAALDRIAQGLPSVVFFAAAGLAMVVAMLKEAYQLAFCDELTGLPTRRALMAGIREAGGNYCLAMVDVDHFKKFNDKFGHDVGDQVLRMVAGRLAKVGGGGTAYRYGGEEFTLLFPGKSRDQVLPHLEKVRETIAESSFNLRGKGRPKTNKRGAQRRNRSKGQPKSAGVTVSLGMADSLGGGNHHMQVLKKADQALYRAKRAGRNRTEG